MKDLSYLLIGFPFFIVLAFRLSENVLIIFNISRAVSLAFSIVHAIDYMICFSFGQFRSPQTVV